MRRFAYILPFLALSAFGMARTGDGETKRDPLKPVCELTSTSFTVQYFTPVPCETRIQIRQGDIPMIAWRPAGKQFAPWADKAIRVVESKGGKSTYHRLVVDGLKPGKRYYYRVYDPGTRPTPQEMNFGAEQPWQRELAISTLAPKGSKTIIHIPVKVILMPYVLNVESAHEASGKVAPLPPKFTEAEMATIREEYRRASLFYWVNNGMRYWVDFQVQVDNRPQRWGPEPTNVSAPYKGWPVCRSWAGVDFTGPGGGDFNIVDSKDPLKVTKDPVYEENPFPGQIEQAFVRKWNSAAQKWEFYTSGGGTLGIEGLKQGVPGRSQYLGGNDTSWLCTHEFHHQMESYGDFSGMTREDDRVVFDHFFTRKRVTKPDGKIEEFAWNTSARFGEHYDGIAYWDRTLSDIQWLRSYFGETIVVKDTDGDGIPDDDPRLPLDEKRFGSNPANAKTDGRMNDLDKAMLSTWVPASLQFTLTKPPYQAIRPDPKKVDQDGDGIPDDQDLFPLYLWQPFVWQLTATVDGNQAEWKDIPLAGEMNKGGLHATFKQAHDESAYYGCITISGDWKKASALLDGEGKGVFEFNGQLFIDITNGTTPEVKARTWSKPAEGFEAKTSKLADGTTVIEFSYPNRGAGEWYWERGGREVGAYLDVTDAKNATWSMYEPYHAMYSVMLTPVGRALMPEGAPAELSAANATKVLKGNDPTLKFYGTMFKVEGDKLVSKGDGESAAYIEVPNVTEFDLWAEVETSRDCVMGAFCPGTKQLNAGEDFIVFVGGYNNTISRYRLLGREDSDSEVMLTPGKHTFQFSRRNGRFWTLWDGKPILASNDPDPKKVVDRLAVLGGFGVDLTVTQIRVKY